MKKDKFIFFSLLVLLIALGRPSITLGVQDDRMTYSYAIGPNSSHYGPQLTVNNFSFFTFCGFSLSDLPSPPPSISPMFYLYGKPVAIQGYWQGNTRYSMTELD
ncbi:hypothetical protein BDV26DRAFT_259233, partial [Aspergillus bertholletiae]